MGQHTIYPGQQHVINPQLSGSPPYSFQIQGAPTWATINPTTGQITLNPPTTLTDAQVISFQFIASNCEGSGQDSEQVRLVVDASTDCVPVVILDPNPGGCNAPAFNPASMNLNVQAGESLTQALAVTGDPTIQVTSSVSWASWAAGVLTIDATSLFAGTQMVTLTAKNSCSPDAQITIPVVVSAAGGGGGGGNCPVTISGAGSSAAVGAMVNYSVSIPGCSNMQTWLTTIGGDDVNGSGFVKAPDGGVGGNYSLNLAGVAPGNYRLWAKCNDGGSCNDSFNSIPFEVTESGGGGGGGGGGTCAVAITAAPATAQPGQLINYHLGMSSGACGGSGGFQTWLTSNPNPGPNGDGYLVGGEGGASRTLTVPAGLADGTYYIWAKCNDGGGCQDIWSVVPIQISASGGGGGGTGCTPPNVLVTSGLMEAPEGQNIVVKFDVDGVEQSGGGWTVYQTGVTGAVVTNDAPGKYTMTFPDTLAEGSYTVQMIFENAPGCQTVLENVIKVLPAVAPNCDPIEFIDENHVINVNVGDALTFAGGGPEDVNVTGTGAATAGVSIVATNGGWAMSVDNLGSGYYRINGGNQIADTVGTFTYTLSVAGCEGSTDTDTFVLVVNDTP